MVPIDYNAFWSSFTPKKPPWLVMSAEREVEPSIQNSFRLPKVAKDCPSLSDLTISTNTTTTTHNEGIILQSNQSNSTEQKKIQFMLFTAYFQ